MSRLAKADKQALAEAASETNKIVSLADEKVKKDSFEHDVGVYDDGRAEIERAVPDRVLRAAETLHDAEDRRAARVRESRRRRGLKPALTS